MVLLTDLQMKEVISVIDGRRIGFIIDLEIDVRTGRVISLILSDREGKGNFFQKAEEIEVPWKNILRIGADVILIREATADGPLMLP